MIDWLSERFKELFKPKQMFDSLGARGENMAAKHLRNQGYKIIIRNYRTPVGEIDIGKADRARYGVERRRSGRIRLGRI